MVLSLAEKVYKVAFIKQCRHFMQHSFFAVSNSIVFLVPGTCSSVLKWNLIRAVLLQMLRQHCSCGEVVATG